MEKALPSDDLMEFEAEFERTIVEDDDSAARAILASGRPIHISRADTPAGHVIRIYPDRREELIRLDLEAAAKNVGPQGNAA